MKKYFSFMFFVMMAVLCLAFVSCSSDDDNEDKENNINSGNSSIKQDLYQFLYNGKQYTYGGYVAKDNSINSRAYFSVDSSDSYSVDIWNVSLRFKGFLLSSEYNEDAWGDRYYKYDEQIDCIFRL